MSRARHAHRARPAREPRPILTGFTVVGLAVSVLGAGYALLNSDGLKAHADCNSTAVPAAAGEVLVFSLQPAVSKSVKVESVALTGATPGIQVVALGYRPNVIPTGSPATVDPLDPSSVRSAKGLKLSGSDQQPFVALVKGQAPGIYSVTGFDVRYEQGLVHHTQHYSDAFAFRVGSDQSPVDEIKFVGCSHWVPTAS